MTRPAILVGLLLLAGCHRPHADQPAPGADSDALAATSAKTLADLKAADEASQGPAPEIAPVVHPDEPREPAPTVTASAPADDSASVPPEAGNSVTPQ